MISIIAYTLFFGVSISDITAVGPAAFLLASAVSIVRLFVQGVRFHELSKGINGTTRINASNTTIARMASEFTDLVVPSYAGGELVKIPWLTKKGFSLGQAILIAYLEVLFDVVIGGLISIIAALYLLTRGIYIPALILLALSFLWIGFFTIVPWLVSRGKGAVPKTVVKIMSSIIGAKRAELLASKLSEVAVQSSQAAGIFFRAAKGIVVKVLLLTVIMVVLAGSIFP